MTLDSLPDLDTSGVNRELIAADALPGARRADELLGERGVLTLRHHPADHVAAEHVEHDVQVEVGPLRRAEQLGDVPAPQLVGAAGQQLRGGIDGMAAATCFCSSTSA